MTEKCEKCLNFVERHCDNDVTLTEEFDRITDTFNIFEEMVEKLEKRIENLEKVYLMLQDDVDKKLEMLRENNNLFATEIEKLGRFQENDDFEALDLSPIKGICNAFEKAYTKDKEVE